mgnify:CR=1 FL=1
MIMAAEDSKARFKDATTLLNHGFGKCQIYRDEDLKPLGEIPVRGVIRVGEPKFAAALPGGMGDIFHPDHAVIMDLGILSDQLP